MKQLGIFLLGLVIGAALAFFACGGFDLGSGPDMASPESINKALSGDWRSVKGTVQRFDRGLSNAGTLYVLRDGGFERMSSYIVTGGGFLHILGGVRTKEGIYSLVFVGSDGLLIEGVEWRRVRQ